MAIKFKYPPIVSQTYSEIKSLDRSIEIAKQKLTKGLFEEYSSVEHQRQDISAEIQLLENLRKLYLNRLEKMKKDFDESGYKIVITNHSL